MHLTGMVANHQAAMKSTSQNQKVNESKVDLAVVVKNITLVIP
jgi:NO-binding membrane sensor protein with MHYT domain